MVQAVKTPIVPARNELRQADFRNPECVVIGRERRTCKGCTHIGEIKLVGVAEYCTLRRPEWKGKRRCADYEEKQGTA
jgi:hypothetical protein